jgi:hypothetical protein
LRPDTIVGVITAIRALGRVCICVRICVLMHACVCVSASMHE